MSPLLSDSVNEAPLITVETQVNGWCCGTAGAVNLLLEQYAQVIWIPANPPSMNLVSNRTSAEADHVDSGGLLIIVVE